MIRVNGVLAVAFFVGGIATALSGDTGWAWVFGACAVANAVMVILLDRGQRRADVLPAIEFDEDFDMGDREDCDYCRGEGVVVTCIDDLCAGEDECIHGDGYGPCPECRGRGFVVVGEEVA